MSANQAVGSIAAVCMFLAGQVAAAVVQVDVRTVLDADVVVNDGSGSLDPTQSPIDSGFGATGNFAFPTRSVAVRQAGVGETPDGLPDDGHFAAGGFHPEVQLGWSNLDDGNNAHRISFATGAFTFAVPPASYTELHLFLTTGDGDADITVRLDYSDATTASFPIFVPDWFDDPVDTPATYHLFDGGDRIQPGSGSGTPFLYEDSDDTAIFGFRLDPDPAKTLASVTIDRTDTTGVLNFFGATAVSISIGAPDLYESANPAAVVTLANRVAFAVTSPHRHLPASGAALYYQVDDGAGSPPLIRVVKRTAEIEFTF